jgi:transcriptional regulator with XRE-family HTH domain
LDPGHDDRCANGHATGGAAVFLNVAMADRNKKAGRRLAKMRLRRGLTLYQVFELSREVAARRRKLAYMIQPSRLSEIESKGVTPTIYKLYSISVIYRCPLRELLALYGVW